MVSKTCFSPQLNHSLLYITICNALLNTPNYFSNKNFLTGKRTSLGSIEPEPVKINILHAFLKLARNYVPHKVEQFPYDGVLKN